MNKSADVANQTAAEAVAAIRTVAAFGMESAMAELFRLELEKPWRKLRQTALVTGVAFGCSFGIIFLVSSEDAGLTSSEVMEGRGTAGFTILAGPDDDVVKSMMSFDMCWASAVTCISRAGGDLAAGTFVRA